MIIIPLLILCATFDAIRSRSIELELDNEIGLGESTTYRQREQYPWVKINQGPRRMVTKNVGQHLELECEAMGSPPPTLQWFKDDKLLTVPVNIDRYEHNIITEELSSGLSLVKSRLVLNYLLPVHEGTFRCFAQSGTETAVAESHVFVMNKENIEMNFTQLVQNKILGAHHKPRVTLWTPTYMDVIGKEVLLPCQGVGNPRPETRWIDPQGELVPSNGRVSILPDGELRIKAVTWNDMGVYTCYVRNNLGQDSAESFLYPMQGA